MDILSNEVILLFFLSLPFCHPSQNKSSFKGKTLPLKKQILPLKSGLHFEEMSLSYKGRKVLNIGKGGKA